MPRLGQRIFDKGNVRLFCLRHIEGRLRDYLKIKRRKQLTEFTKFAGVAGGEDKFFHSETLS